MLKESQSQEITPGNHEKISYTAIGVAYARTFSDIPYSKEISNICDANNLTPESAEFHHKIAPYLEARFKSLTNLLTQSGVKNILELASGASQRDLIMTQDPEVNYIETDLPNMLQQKRAILDKLCEQTGIQLPKNLNLFELNALDEENFRKVIDDFPDGPIAIGHEGLLSYLSHKEKQKLAEIIKNILTERGGVWITPDIFTVADLQTIMNEQSQSGEKTLDQIKARTGRDFDRNVFTDLDEAKEFFSNLGFDFAIRTIGETAGELTSTKIGLDKKSVEDQLGIKIWELRPKI